MNIKRLLSVAIIITLSLCLASCSSFRTDAFTRDDNKIADTRFKKIIEALENTDKEGLKKMFSTKAVEEANDIDGGIEYLMELYKGKIKSKDVALETSGSKDNGDKTVELKCYYTVTTDEETYIVFFIEQIQDTSNTDNVGLYMLQIIKQIDEDKEFDWGSKTRCAGIYRSTITKNEM
ncbi:DUF5104 domain-containing protein [Ruminiclostridium cellobioparum]|uniref:DUF5104 domain-containing protein n=1 Tax=Ruminiclostridium cellobioparum TaxID=29355 RepID=UPI0004873DED|nr:DUF5104 domain-containing protein [Ruminiclostridium cellobioparum]